MYNGPFAWFYFLPLSQQKKVRKAVLVLTRTGMVTEEALQLLWDADRNRRQAEPSKYPEYAIKAR